MRIYIHRNAGTLGPYSLEQAREKLIAGTLSPSDLASYDGNKMPLAQVPNITLAPKAKFRLGCCGWIVVAALFITVVMSFEYLTEEKTEFVSNGVATIKVTEYHASGDYRYYGRDRDVFAGLIAEAAWESAKAHPEVATINVQVYGRYPERTDTDHYGNQKQVAGRIVHLCDFVISDLAEIRRYQTKERYVVDDSRYSYQQKIEPTYQTFWKHVQAQYY